MADLSRSTTPPDGYAVLDSTERFAGSFLTVRSDRLQLGTGTERTYDVVGHPGAAAVVALDDGGRVLLVHQWRPAIGASEWELPAGIRDHGDEPVQAVAERELAEETGVTATSWSHLLTLHPSPGYAAEQVEVFLARGATRTQDPDREDSEAGMTTTWVDLAEAVAAVRAGQITSAMTVAGLLAAAGDR